MLTAVAQLTYPVTLTVTETGCTAYREKFEPTIEILRQNLCFCGVCVSRSKTGIVWA